MDENYTSQDVLIPETPESETPQPQPEPFSVLRVWEVFWQKVTKLELADDVLRLGTGILTVLMVVLVVWVMGSILQKGEMVTAAEQQQQTAQEQEPVSSGDTAALALPAYEGVQPVDGISRQNDFSTEKPTTSRFEVTKYEVVSGDTVFGIADQFGLKPETILWGNYYTLLDNPAAIYPGQVLNILPVDGVYHPWKEGEGLNGVSNGYGVSPEDIIEWPGNNLNAETIGDYANPNIEVETWLVVPNGTREFVNWSAPQIRRDNPAVARILGPGHCEPVSSGPIGTGAFIWPTTETYISGYEFIPAVNHWGIDIGGDIGNPIFGMDKGVVVYAGWNDWGYGNVVVIDHGNGWQTLYAHLDTYNVGCGTYITYGGEVIGTMGSTGKSSGPHLHLEMMYNGTRVNPHKYLPY